MASSVLNAPQFQTEGPFSLTLKASFGPMGQFARTAAMPTRSAFARCRARPPALAFTSATSARASSLFVREPSLRVPTFRCIFGCRSSI